MYLCVKSNVATEFPLVFCKQQQQGTPHVGEVVGARRIGEQPYDLRPDIHRQGPGSGV